MEFSTEVVSTASLRQLYSLCLVNYKMLTLEQHLHLYNKYPWDSAASSQSDMVYKSLHTVMGQAEEKV